MIEHEHVSEHDQKFPEHVPASLYLYGNCHAGSSGNCYILASQYHIYERSIEWHPFNAMFSGI